MQQEEKIKEQAAEIARLEARIEDLSSGLTRLAKVAREYDELLSRQSNMIEKSVEDAFARIVNLELKVFPNLAGDIDRLHGIIGDGDNKAYNPLDRRKP
jgi:molecular chaperone GrpE (heat shock protein)